jgi:hypothetical protein
MAAFFLLFPSSEMFLILRASRFYLIPLMIGGVGVDSRIDGREWFRKKLVWLLWLLRLLWLCNPEF